MYSVRIGGTKGWETREHVTEISGLDMTQRKFVRKEGNNIEEKKLEEASPRNAHIYQIAGKKKKKQNPRKLSKSIQENLKEKNLKEIA